MGIVIVHLCATIPLPFGGSDWLASTPGGLWTLWQWAAVFSTSTRGPNSPPGLRAGDAPFSSRPCGACALAGAERRKDLWVASNCLCFHVSTLFFCLPACLPAFARPLNRLICVPSPQEGAGLPMLARTKGVLFSPHPPWGVWGLMPIVSPTEREMKQTGGFRTSLLFSQSVWRFSNPRP